ncbi:methyl-accepting chemotaxis protein [Romboutsia sp. 1001216sp1]|uniref:methyl-accepting chemotaxis protein n=1 Tax=Romboutsia TaxID=1501226 RepID=UPI000A7751B6|nr:MULTISPECIES: methyl-accepting chemotaxis protein [Romboutsia]MDB8789691.1 methyl-accepting chemotaxis protein [Romboutsia sp. 1001216sp1]MDB8792969.1 methyl-accepting chemotaxis protein [Romboutsia sp. 1001216sp1]MDB8795228.1 methyl-accepting chemotaxis protein [Romboutsia sp. 1001216sp1]MDB8799037.1 methyl-accepting chemotaxis protein [Romboutsia sp. 1001216sp1]MDB8801839.1 methyl-accepting chemotaxis protein [Romboutsia sp. 1001216sp1]
METKLWHRIKGKSKSKSIKNQLTLIIVSFSVISCLLLGTVTSYLNYKSANSVLSKTIVETTKQAAQTATQKITNIKNATIQTGIIKEISDPKVSKEEKESIIDRQEKLYGMKVGQIIDTNGKDIFSGNDYSDRDYFKASINGKAYLGSPVLSKVTGENILVVSAPIWENGVENSKVVGVVTFDLDKDYLNDIVRGIDISENSYAYLVDNQGTTIAHRDASLVNAKNTIKEAESNESLKPFAQADEKLISGETGFSDANLNGEDWILGYAPVKNSNGWGMGIMVNKSDFLGEMYKSIIYTGILTVVVTVLAIFVAIRFSKKIGNPLKECSERLNKLAQGDLNSEVPVIDEENEIGLVADATYKIVNDFRSMINALTYILTEVSDGNLDIHADSEEYKNLFVKDFEPILIALNKIVYDLNNTLIQINEAGEQVAVSSYQLSEGAQVLSQGTTEQASSIEELSATINEVSSQIKETAEHALRAKDISLEASKATDKSKEQMKEMITAMDDINTTSNEIGNIIKNIDDIAFQTNILALNAAVEAARAGEAGKGFAVVADEVRNLAAKSAQSAKDTAELIEKSLKAIEKGTIIVSDTAKSLEAVVEGAKNSANVIQYIADVSNEQANHISQVNVGVEQISVVVQTNSATAEESAAASEELSAQAQMLKELIGKFNLKDEENKYFDGKISFSDEQF